MPQFRYVGTQEHLHVGPPVTVLNHGEVVWAATNPDPALFEPAGPDTDNDQ